MFKSKIAIITMACMLALCVGLTACGGGNKASSSAAASSSASASSSSAAASSSASAASKSASSSSTASSAVAFWQGTLQDGSGVIYSDDAASSEAALAVIKSDLSDGVAWVGPYKTDADGVYTITDSETGKTFAYMLSDKTSNSMKMELEGYGEVTLAPVTEAEFNEFAAGLAVVANEGEKLMKSLSKEGKKLEKEIRKESKKFMDEINSLDDSTVLFWDGTLADGTSVSYMDDPASKEACLALFKADLSDGAAWYGKYTTSDDGKVYTITDAETGKTITYAVAESTPNTSMKMEVEGIGAIDLKPVTKGEFVKFAEELSKLMKDSAAK